MADYVRQVHKTRPRQRAAHARDRPALRHPAPPSHPGAEPHDDGEPGAHDAPKGSASALDPTLQLNEAALPYLAEALGMTAPAAGDDRRSRSPPPSTTLDGAIHAARPYVSRLRRRRLWKSGATAACTSSSVPATGSLRVSHCGVCATDLARRASAVPLAAGDRPRGRRASTTTARPSSSRSTRRTPRVGSPSDVRVLRARARVALSRATRARHPRPRRRASVTWLLAPVDAVHRAAAVPRCARDGDVSSSRLRPRCMRSADRDARAARVASPCWDHGSARPARHGGARRLASRRTGAQYEIVALARRADRRDLARRLGADDGARSHDARRRRRRRRRRNDRATRDGLGVRSTLARDEVHLKTTCGQPVGSGSRIRPALVVDEITLARATCRSTRRSAVRRYETASVFDHAPALRARRVSVAQGLRVDRRRRSTSLHATPFRGDRRRRRTAVSREINEAIRPSGRRGVAAPRCSCILARRRPTRESARARPSSVAA